MENFNNIENIDKNKIKEFENEKNKKKEEKKLIIRVINSLNLGPYLDEYNNKPYKLTYPDIIDDFKNWEKQDDLIKEYPSVLFWLTKYNDIVKEFPEFSGDDNSIDFWFFCFRILTSINCIKSDISKTKYADYINSLIRKKLSINNNQTNLGKGWINLMMKNPLIIKNEKLSNLYAFLYIILTDNKEFKKDIESQKELNLKQIISIIFDKVFNNELEDFIDGKNINEPNNRILIKFFSNPNEYIYDILKGHLIHLFENLENNTVNLKQIYESFLNSISSKLNEIENICTEENEIKKNFYIEDEIKKKEINFNESIRVTKENIKEYNLNLQNVKSSLNDYKKNYSNDLEEIKKLFKELKVFQENKETETENYKKELKEKKNKFKQKLLNNNYLSDIQFEEFNNVLKPKNKLNENLFLKDEKDKSLKCIKYEIQPISGETKSEFYLIKEYQNKCCCFLVKSGINLIVDENTKILIYEKKNYNEQNNKKILKVQEEYNFYSIDENVNIENIFIKEKETPPNPDYSPRIIFGRNKTIQIDDFSKEINNYSLKINKLHDVLNLVNELSQNYDEEKGKQYSENIKLNLMNIQNDNQSILQFLTCKFNGNGGECLRVQEKLNQFKTDLEQFIQQFDNFNYEIQHKIIIFWDLFNELESKIDIFSYDYSLPIIHEENKIQFSFEGLQPDCKCLSLPLILLDGNEIKCQPEKLIYNLGSFCPNLYEKN